MESAQHRIIAAGEGNSRELVGAQWLRHSRNLAVAFVDPPETYGDQPEWALAWKSFESGESDDCDTLRCASNVMNGWCIRKAAFTAPTNVAAVSCKQTPVLDENLVASIIVGNSGVRNRGYGSYSTVTGDGQLTLSEVDDQNGPSQSLPFEPLPVDQSKETWSKVQWKGCALRSPPWSEILGTTASEVA